MPVVNDRPSEVEHRVAVRDGAHLHVEVAGAGERVLLIHGLGHATWAWSPQLSGLSGAHRVIAYDHRGSGWSDKPPGPYSIRLLAEDAAAVLRATGGPAHVVGASMGGYVAITLAARHPEMVRSLALIATSWGGVDAVGTPRSTTETWLRWAGHPAERFARETMPLSFAPGWTKRHPEEFDELLSRRLRQATPPAAWRHQFRACEAFLRTGAGPDPLHHPALVLHGTADRVVPYVNANPLVGRLSQGRLVTLGGAGHLCWLERAAQVNRHIADLVTRTAGG